MNRRHLQKQMLMGVQPIAIEGTCRRFNAIVPQLKMHDFSEGAFESLIASQLLKKEKYI